MQGLGGNPVPACVTGSGTRARSGPGVDPSGPFDPPSRTGGTRWCRITSSHGCGSSARGRSPTRAGPSSRISNGWRTSSPPGGARPALRRAGLCHAFYGTDGFPRALLPLARRAELAAVIGDEAEEIVYAYAACDRTASYPTLACEEAAFRDRFTGHVHSPAPWLRRDLAELSAANELDLARIDPAFRDAWGAELRALFERLRGLLSEPARRECRAVLGDGEG